MKIKVPTDKVQEVVKQFFWIAYCACGGTSGLGFLKERSGVTPEQVLQNVMSDGDYPGGGFLTNPKHPYGDYVFGRMMKTGIKIEGDILEIRDDKPRRDYQGWCRVYDSYEALLKAACQNAGVEFTKV